MDDTDGQPIAFNRAFLTGREQGLIADALARGQLSGDGHYTHLASRTIETITTSPKVFLTTSCTHALEMCTLLLDLQPGDEVIMPSFAFVSTANACALRGGVPVFVDIRADTWNIDETLIEAAITPRTKAIMVVHYGGVACEMDTIMAIAAAHGLAVVEDAAHAFGATYRGRVLGSIGDLGTLSFHATKNIQCGEGGALLVNDPLLRERAEIIREKGTNRGRFFRGEVDKYTWVDVGSSYLPSEILAAFLTAQLDAFDEIHARRMQIWSAYESAIRPWALDRQVQTAAESDHCRHPAHLFALGFSHGDQRQSFIDHMAAAAIKTAFHFVPLHSAPAARRWVGDLHLPVTDAVSDGLVRLPLYPGLSTDQVTRVIEAALRFEMPSPSAAARA